MTLWGLFPLVKLCMMAGVMKLSENLKNREKEDCTNIVSFKTGLWTRKQKALVRVQYREM